MRTVESVNEGQFWFREMEGIVRSTRIEAERNGIALPSDFAHDARWWKAEAQIEKAMFAGDYIKTRDLSKAYVARVDKYCRAWLAKQLAKGAGT